jgi:hypothetical protein
MKGVKVSNFIVPMSVTDTYPTNLEIFGRGGIHSVDAISNRDAITTERRSEGMLSFTKNNESMYALLGGITNDKWFKLFDFSDNKVNFNIACDPNYVLLGNKDGVAKPSPRLRDMQFDIIDLRRRIDKIGILENLDYEHLWIGDYTNRPIQKINIAVKNLPILGAALFPIPLLDVSIPIPNPNFDPTSGLDYVMSSPWLNQIYAGSPNLLNTSTETKISSSLAFAQIKAAQAIKRLDNAGFIVKNKTISYSWENPAYSFVTDPLLIAAMELYGLGTTYTFNKAQALDELGTGLLKNSTEGVLSLGVSGEDYVNTADIPIGNLVILDPLYPLAGHKLIAPTTFSVRKNNPGEFGYPVAGIIDILIGIAGKFEKFAVTGLTAGNLIKADEFGELKSAIPNVDYTTPSVILTIFSIISALQAAYDLFVAATTAKDIAQDVAIATIQVKDIAQDLSITAAQATATIAQGTAITAEATATGAATSAAGASAAAAAAGLAITILQVQMLLKPGYSDITSAINALKLNNIAISGNIDMGNFQLVNLGAPTLPDGAATKLYVDTAIANVPSGIMYINLSGDIIGSGFSNLPIPTTFNITRDFDVNMHKVVNVKEPEIDSDATNFGFMWNLLNDDVSVLW